MKIIRSKWTKWLAIPLAIVLALAVVLPMQLSHEPEPVFASGVAVSSNVTLTGQDDVNNFTFVQFDIAWNYSWRDGVNWDAIWVFVKYQPSTSANWSHATLDTSGHTAPTGSTITPASDGKGVFIYRDSVGNGTVNWSGVKLKWKYGTDNLADSAMVTVKVFAIEMVYIPTGPFDVGDGNGTNESTNALHVTDNTSFTVNTTLVQNIKVDVNDYDDDQLEAQAGKTGIGIKGDGGLDTNNDGSIDNADFPTGYNAFYMMKYEMSQRQYAEFLNTLTATQKTNRYGGNPDAVKRYYIELQTGVYGTDANGNNTLNESDDGEWIACHYINWPDSAAYADWAGLRPMTGLEYEKAARGPNSAVYDEYAWGNTQIASDNYTLSSANQTSEAIATNYATGSTGNAIIDATMGAIGRVPLRVGIFATANSTRAEAGASYYGVMELSGNLWEQPVTVGTAAGREFTGLHGDGSLTTAGDANVLYWPTAASWGAGLRGGSHTDAGKAVSERSQASYSVAKTDRHTSVGFRGARTAP